VQLPTEIEWECAVRGTDDKGFPYPWGSGDPNRDRCRIFNGEHLERGEGGPVPVDQLAAGASPLGLTHVIGNAAEWCKDSDRREGFVLRGCSIATANMNDIRVTWRARGDVKGEESSGFRVVVELPEFKASPSKAITQQTSPVTTQQKAMGSTAGAKPATSSATLPPGGGGPVSSTVGLMFSLPWSEMASGLSKSQLPTK